MITFEIWDSIRVQYVAMVALYQLEAMAERIGLTHTDLLGLAREVAQDAKLLSICHMTVNERESLYIELIRNVRPHFPIDIAELVGV